MGTGLINKTRGQLLAVVLVALLSHGLTKAHYLEEIGHLQAEKGRVTGFGGVFFKTDNPTALKAWYAENLGFKTNEYGTLFETGKPNGNQHKAYMQWSPFSSKSTYFEGELMMNYRVDDLEALLTKLKANGVTVVDTLAAYDYGKFIHIRDLEGNKIELWEPVDAVFSQYTEGAVTK